MIVSISHSKCISYTCIMWGKCIFTENKHLHFAKQCQIYFSKKIGSGLKAMHMQKTIALDPLDLLLKKVSDYFVVRLKQYYLIIYKEISI